ncbi:hypothetical protein VTN77DRAFT_6885 [Rasamsonia byssochlamydoides]|uniref:uncharacterized protein n=1 Tax=Rasamsonia byssochlamydoides TaxID=89139 RepID=UPI0037447B8F
MASNRTHPERLRCIIIGAGFSGILMAYKLQQAFGDDVEFQIFEKNADVGGTWFENRYPGCACDVPSHIYQFSFCPNPYWSRFYASSDEIRSYLKAVVLHYQLDQYIHLNSKVEEAIWHEDASLWTVTVAGKGRLDCEILINAGGILNNPQYPRLKNLNCFRGKLVHTAAWDSQIDVTDKRVAIIGAGASAIQVLPALQPHAAHIDIYIRTPSWITPPAGEKFNNEHNHIYTEDEKARFRDDPESSLRTRKAMESSFNAMYKAFFKNSDAQREWRVKLEARMKELIASETLQQKLIPSFEVGCRRVNPGERYLEALQKRNVEPVFDAIDHVTPDGILAIDGKHRPVDIIVAATGFDTSFCPRFPIIGRDGIDLRKLWKDDPVSYCGLAVSGFPNYLIFLGPNTPIANGSLIGVLDATADFFVRLIRKMRTQQAVSFNVRPAVQADFNAHTQQFMQRMVWTGSCRSWFKDNASGKVTAVWPGSGLHYREFLQSDRWEDFEWKYDGNCFAYWGEGYSAVERGSEGEPDLSYYITQHPCLPWEALCLAEAAQKGQEMEEAESSASAATPESAPESEPVFKLETQPQEEKEALDKSWDEISSMKIDVDTGGDSALRPEAALPQVAAFSA